MWVRTKLDEAPIFTKKKRRFIEFGSEEERRNIGESAYPHLQEKKAKEEKNQEKYHVLYEINKV